jgi:alkylhydroperoxidase family enzyme
MSITTYKILLFMKRRPGMTVEAFRDYYENRHVPLCMKYASGVKRYLRRYLDPQPNAESGRNDELPFDVITELWFDDEATFRGTVKYLATSRMPDEVVEDEKQLFDRASMRMATVVECSSADDPAQREAQLLGAGPRIEPMRVEEFTDDLHRIVLQMAEVNNAIDARGKAELIELLPGRDGIAAEQQRSQLDKVSEIVLTMLRHPELFVRQTELGIQLLGQGALDPRDRELAILRIGWLCQAPYEWGEHVHIAHKAGLDSDAIERITQGSQAPGWSEHERAILRAVEELYESATISDATWAALSERLDEKQLIELPILIGHYQTVAYYQNALRLRLHEGNAGLRAR